MGRGPVRCGVAALLALATMAAAGCRSPTQITVEVTTDVKCSDIRGTAFTVGDLASLDLDRRNDRQLREDRLRDRNAARDRAGERGPHRGRRWRSQPRIDPLALAVPIPTSVHASQLPAIPMPVGAASALARTLFHGERKRHSDARREVIAAVAAGMMYRAPFEKGP
jgi:hypothetical protein